MAARCTVINLLLTRRERPSRAHSLFFDLFFDLYGDRYKLAIASIKKGTAAASQIPSNRRPVNSCKYKLNAWG